jgi:futalosine hydrolase
MKIAVFSATEFELLPFLDFLESDCHKASANCYSFGNHHIEIHITGIGISETSYYLGRNLSRNHTDFAIQIGIAGAIDRNLILTDVYAVNSDFEYDLGFEESDGSLHRFFDTGLIDANQFPFVHGKLYHTGIHEFPFFSSVSGMTVNRVHGSAQSIQLLLENPPAQIETMETAPFFKACLREQIPFLCLRAISNYVEIRNRENWKVKESIEKLNEQLIQLISVLCSKTEDL